MKYKHIVLDLDATLIHSIQKDQTAIKIIKTDPQYSYLKERSRIIEVVDLPDNSEKGSGSIISFIVVLRPYVFEFIDFLMKNFKHVSIYSAGQKRYVRAIESILFPVNSDIYKEKFKTVLTFCHVEFTQTKNHLISLKDLERVGFDLKDTLIIDDNPTSFGKNPQNVIHIPAYTPELNKEQIMKDDKTLLNIKIWMEKHILYEGDIRHLDKTNACY